MQKLITAVIDFVDPIIVTAKCIVVLAVGSYLVAKFLVLVGYFGNLPLDKIW